ncbi:MAG: hypothetical protein GC190_02640 [Alphaproteobacteria bacterium]|nr:hypothetical protein [Alphaproteobacteria bacterium]
MHYVTIWEYSPQLWFTGLFALFVPPVVIAMVLRQRRWSIRTRAPALIVAGVFCSFVWPHVITAFLETSRAVDSAHVITVEGRVHDLRVVCKDRQTYVVGDTAFTYPDSCPPTPGFVQAPKWSAAALREGTQARVTYFDSSWGERVVTKVEVQPE